MRDWPTVAEAPACTPLRKNPKVQFEYDARLDKMRNRL